MITCTWRQLREFISQMGEDDCLDHTVTYLDRDSVQRNVYVEPEDFGAFDNTCLYLEDTDAQ